MKVGRGAASFGRIARGGILRAAPRRQEGIFSEHLRNKVFVVSPGAHLDLTIKPVEFVIIPNYAGAAQRKHHEIGWLIATPFGHTLTHSIEVFGDSPMP